jgi:hypothetical protein
MKKTLTIIGLLALFISCNKEDTSMGDLTSEKLTTTSLSETLDKLYLDEDIATLIQSNLTIDDAANKSASTSKDSATSTSLTAHGGNSHGGEGQGSHHFEGDEYGSCAVVTIDTIANTKLIDFGTGCSDNHGEMRSGQIFITYSSNRDEVGSYRQIEFINFFKDSINIQGTRRMEIIDIDEFGNMTMQTTLTNGKMVYVDGTFETKNSNMIRYQYRDPNDRTANYSTIFGTESGVDTEGVPYTMEITTPIKFVRNCAETIYGGSGGTNPMGSGMTQGNNRSRRQGRKVPVEGVKVLTSGSDVITIDFGDGTCDTSADVTTNGVTETVDISTLPRGNAFGKLFRRGNGH